jgi:hypothetical protein
VHGANGYFIDQFISSSTNLRTDAYDGPVERRARFLIEMVEAVGEVWGLDRVGVRLSPLGQMNNISDSDPEATFGYIAETLDDLRFAYLHIANPAAAALEKGLPTDARAERMLALIRQKYRGILIIAGGFDHDHAEQIRRGRRHAAGKQSCSRRVPGNGQPFVAVLFKNFVIRGGGRPDRSAGRYAKRSGTFPSSCSHHPDAKPSHHSDAKLFAPRFSCGDHHCKKIRKKLTGVRAWTITFDYSSTTYAEQASDLLSRRLPNLE